MRVLDLFAGLRGWSDAWRARGHEVWAIDNDPKFDVDSHQDILQLRPDDLPWVPDVILASPPCTSFTVMTIGRNWHYDGTPKTDTARLGQALVGHTLDLIHQLQPRYWVMENPRGKLRKLHTVRGIERRTVTYCQLGDTRRKPTDLWGGFPPGLVLPPMCRNGDPCHVAAPRGSHTPGSTQGLDRSEDRSKVPEQLALLVCLAAEGNPAPGPGALSLWEAYT